MIIDFKRFTLNKKSFLKPAILYLLCIAVIVCSFIYNRKFELNFTTVIYPAIAIIGGIIITMVYYVKPKSDISQLENKEVEFMISDTGMGIDEKNFKAIFLPFITFKDSNHSVYDGIGLGLTISKGLVDLLNGTIDVGPVYPHGASFYVTIPISASDNMESNTPSRLTISAIHKILVVQYGFESTNALRDILAPYNINVIQAYDGIGAIEMYYEHHDIDLVICDVRLSDMTGIEVLKAIMRINKSATVIAQSSYFVADEKKKCIEAGFAEYLVKPIDKTALLSVIKIN